MNKWIGTGNVGADPDVRSFPEGGKVANFSIACTERWKDGEGQPQERTEWVRINVQAEGLVTSVVEPHIKKCSKLFIEGKLETREYTDRDGVKRAITEVCIRPYRGSIELMGDSPSRSEAKPEGKGRAKSPKP